jgi:hypothetical protein
MERQALQGCLRDGNTGLAENHDNSQGHFAGWMVDISNLNKLPEKPI